VKVPIFNVESGFQFEDSTPSRKPWKAHGTNSQAKYLLILLLIVAIGAGIYFLVIPGIGAAGFADQGELTAWRQRQRERVEKAEAKPGLSMKTRRRASDCLRKLMGSRPSSVDERLLMEIEAAHIYTAAQEEETQSLFGRPTGTGEP
jgi:hypothetical protein